jgi:hypothetical protein
MALLFLLVCLSSVCLILTLRTYILVVPCRMQASIKRPCSGLCDGLLRARDRHSVRVMRVFNTMCVHGSDLIVARAIPFASIRSSCRYTFNEHSLDCSVIARGRRPSHVHAIAWWSHAGSRWWWNSLFDTIDWQHYSYRVHTQGVSAHELASVAQHKRGSDNS